MTNCHSIRDALLGFISDEIKVLDVGKACVLVMPGKTLDDRRPAVFVEQRTPDFFLVHDAGKTSSELYAQGVHLTDTRADVFGQMAERLGAVFVDGMFQIGCKQSELHSAIFAISECASLGMWHILGHKPDLSDEPVLSRISRGLRAWNARYPHEIKERVPIKGRKATHTFDFVSFPAIEFKDTLALKVLRPSDDSLAKAREYGFLVYDIEKTIFERWLRVAILTKADRWTKNAKELVHALSAYTIEVDSGEEERLEEYVPRGLDQLVA